MLVLKILNVGQGSSVIVEFTDQNHIKHFGVVDSNSNAGETPRALEQLKKSGCQRLSFVALSHPHDDHFLGMYEILQYYDGNIGEFYSFPLGSAVLNGVYFKKICAQWAELLKISNSTSIRAARLELINIFRWAFESHRRKRIEWRELDGDENYLAPTGFSSVDIKSILPPKTAKADLMNAIENKTLDLPGKLNLNDLSFALCFTYAGVDIVLGCDGSRKNWLVRRRYSSKRGVELSAPIVNLPHHGSSIDCSQDVLDQIFDLKSDGERFAITSSGGITHPDPENIQWLARRGVKPYCTNLMPLCGANVVGMQPNVVGDPLLARMLQELAVERGSTQACQGDITIQVLPDGQYSVASETGALCWLRKEWDPFL